MAPDTHRPLDAARLIAAYEGGLAQAGLLPDATQTLGQRMRALLALRVARFGRHADVIADCPSCGAMLDVPLDLAALLAVPAPEEQAITLREVGLEVALRAPNAADLAAAMAQPNPARALFEACVIAARQDGAAVPPAQLPEPVREAAAAAIAARDPLTEVTLALVCPACAATAAIGLDAEALLAQDIAAEGPRLLAEVATLARSFGWSEAAILAMPPARCRAYLALAG